MEIGSLVVSGFRPLHNVDIRLDDLTVLIGPNGSGKSSILAALRVFFTPHTRLDERDFWRSREGTVVDEVTIRVTFDRLTPEAEEAFGPYVTDGKLVVERYFPEPGVGEYLAYRAAVPDFTHIRNLPKGHRDAYNRLVDSGQFEGLERASSKDDAFAQMAAWEQDHPDSCEEAAETVDFVRLSASEPTAIASYLRFLFVGALEDPGAHLAAEGQGAVGELIKEAVDTTELEQALTRISADADAQAGAALESLEDVFAAFRDSTAEALNQFAPGFSVELSWGELSRMTASRPRIHASVRRSDGFETDLEYQGHGIQRSLMYGVLTARATSGERAPTRTLMLAIEEPEAFQHPLSARVLARTLLDLAGRGYQVIYSTHSPDLVSPRAVRGLRLVTRVSDEVGSAHARVEAFDLDELAVVFGQAVNRDDITSETLAVRLDANLERRVLEGLFARACVLVEGDEDEALLRAACLEAGSNLDERGIAIIQTRGKTGMPLTLAFLSHAGVPCYPIFDLDRDKTNQDDQQRWAELALQKLQQIDPEPPLETTTVDAKYACFEHNVGATVAGEFGSDWERLLNEASNDFGYVPTQGRKVAPVLYEALRQATSARMESPSLRAVAAQVLDLVPD